MIVYILNAARVWSGPIEDPRRLGEAVAKSRIYATLEVVKAIAKNPQHGYWGALAAKVSVVHDDFLPPHLGQHGIPLITPFSGANERAGMKADPDEVDDYRNDTLGLFTSSLGMAIPHNQADSNGMPSPVSGFWSIVNNQLKFTGHSARVPMIQFSEADCDAKTPVAYLPTIVKLAPLWNLKEGDNLAGIAAQLVSAGRDDLRAIEAGAMSVSPVSDLVEV